VRQSRFSLWLARVGQRSRSWQLYFAMASIVAITPSLIGCATSPMASGTPGIVASARLVVTPSSIDFSSAVVGVQSSQTLQVANTGEEALTVTGVVASGQGLSINGFSGSTLLNPGTSSTLTVQFTPKAAGPFTGNLSVMTNTATINAAVPIAGTVAAANLTIAVGPTSVNFGTVSAGKAASQSVTLTNTGNTEVTVSKISVSGTGFSMTGGGAPLQLSSSQSVTVDVQFDSSVAGKYTGALMVSSNASDSSVDVPLAGTVAAAPSSPAPSVGLKWNASTSTVTGYNVYRGGASSGPFTRVNGSLVPELSYTDQTVVAGSTYYYVTTAVDSAGVESGYSNAAEAVVP